MFKLKNILCKNKHNVSYNLLMVFLKTLFKFVTSIERRLLQTNSLIDLENNL